MWKIEIPLNSNVETKQLPPNFLRAIEREYNEKYLEGVSCVFSCLFLVSSILSFTQDHDPHTQILNAL